MKKREAFSSDQDDSFSNNDDLAIKLSKDRRRQLHTQAEQRRRDAIKSGYDALLPIIQAECVNANELSNSQSNSEISNDSQNDMTHSISDAISSNLAAGSNQNACGGAAGGGGGGSATGLHSKMSKATILMKTINQINKLTETKQKKQQQMENLRKEVIALKIMNDHYQEIIKSTGKNEAPTQLSQTHSSAAAVVTQSCPSTHKEINPTINNLYKSADTSLDLSSSTIKDSVVEPPASNATEKVSCGAELICDEKKFEVYQRFIEQLFASFDKSTNMSNFLDASACIIRWLEEYCKPQYLQELMDSVIQETFGNIKINTKKPVLNPTTMLNNAVAQTSEPQEFSSITKSCFDETTDAYNFPKNGQTFNFSPQFYPGNSGSDMKNADTTENNANIANNNFNNINNNNNLNQYPFNPQHFSGLSNMFASQNSTVESNCTTKPLNQLNSYVDKTKFNANDDEKNCSTAGTISNEHFPRFFV